MPKPLKEDYHNKDYRPTDKPVEEFLREYQIKLEKIANDIFKNLIGDGIIYSDQWRDDIRQEVLTTFCECYHKHQKGKFPIFPPKSGYIYTTAYWSFRRGIIGILSHQSDIKLYFMAHDDVNSIYDGLGYDPFEEEEELKSIQTKEQKKERLINWLNHIGVGTTDALGIEFSLWWQGLHPGDISSLMASLGLKGKNQRQIEDKLRRIFRELAERSGMTVDQVKALREQITVKA